MPVPRRCRGRDFSRTLTLYTGAEHTREKPRPEATQHRASLPTAWHVALKLAASVGVLAGLTQLMSRISSTSVVQHRGIPKKPWQAPFAASISRSGLGLCDWDGGGGDAEGEYGEEFELHGGGLMVCLG